MNIFYLDADPILAAQYHTDRHVVKMILESAQLLSTAHRILDGDPIITKNKAGHKMTIWKHPDEEKEMRLYKAFGPNHPCAVWTRQSSGNYSWLLRLLMALLQEYEYRYGKKHKTAEILGLLIEAPKNIRIAGFSTPALAMDDEYKVQGDPIASYRKYYKDGKAHLHAWTKREKPAWLQE